MERTELRADVRERIGETVENFWKDSFINRHLAQGVRRFNNEEKWPWLLTKQDGIPVGAGAPTIELIDNIPLNRHLGVVLRKDTDLTVPLVMKRVTLARGLQLMHDYSAVGEPKWFFPSAAALNTYGDGDTAAAVTITLIPTPSVDYTAEFFYYSDDLAVLAADTDEPQMPESYQDAAIAWATAQCFLKELNGGGKAQEQFNIFNTILENARASLKGLAQDEGVVWGDANEPERLTAWNYRLPAHLGDVS